MEDSSPKTQSQSKPVRVLCVEDEHFITELYTRALTKAGYIVTVVFDGAEGLKAALDGTYDIILLDIMLPTMTGVEVLRRLREQAPDLRSKVIITTNLEQREETRELIEKQADGYIIKAEITPRQLVEILKNLAV